MTVTNELLRVPEVARRLGLEGPAVYELIKRGELDTGKGEDGLVYVTVDALRDYKQRHAAASR